MTPPWDKYPLKKNNLPHIRFGSAGTEAVNSPPII
jgi:hypothetical protein